MADTASISAIAALSGSVIGGLASLLASWLTHHTQFREKGREASWNRREKLYRAFIEEASKLYADAYQHEAPNLADLVSLYALVNAIQILSSPAVIESAERTLGAIIDTYLSPNKTFAELAKLAKEETANPMRDFGIACRDELQGRGSW